MNQPIEPPARLTPAENELLHETLGTDSAPTDRADEPAEIPDQHPSVIYVWQMFNADEVWNIIGMQMPNGVQMPLVTTSFKLAWEAFELAQAHANRFGRRCRLACFSLDGELAIVDPETERE